MRSPKETAGRGGDEGQRRRRRGRSSEGDSLHLLDWVQSERGGEEEEHLSWTQEVDSLGRLEPGIGLWSRPSSHKSLLILQVYNFKARGDLPNRLCLFALKTPEEKLVIMLPLSSSAPA